MAIVSCTQEIDPHLDDYQPKLVINAEIQPEKPIYLFISTSVGVTSNDSPHRPVEPNEFSARIIVNEDLEGAEAISYFEKEEEDGGDLAWRTRRAFRTEAGQRFELQAELLQKEEVIPVTAVTAIPEPVTITCQFIEKESNQDIDAQGQYRIQLDMDNQIINDQSYYHLIARYKGTYLDISNFANGNIIVERPYHHHGVLIDGTDLDESLLNFLVESPTEIDEVEIELRKCTKTYFDYHVSLSRSYASQSSPYNEQTQNYSNIKNGLGVFCAYSVSNQLLILK